MGFDLVATADGSWSCVDSETGQQCHNRAGAYAEAVGLYARPSQLWETLRTTGEIRLLDACYGMGYNTWAFLNECLRWHAETFPSSGEPARTDFTVSVVAVERSAEVVAFLPRILTHPTWDDLKSKTPALEHNTYYRTLWAGSTVTEVTGFGRFCFEPHPADLRATLLNLQGNFDAVFHDPFSPQKMPELWTVELFQAYARLLRTRQGKLLTYSAAAAVRAGLIEAGFTVRQVPGVGDKAGSTMGTLSATHGADTAPLSEWEQAYLATRAGIPYRDAGLTQSREAILALRAKEQAHSGRVSGARLLKNKPRP